MGPLAFGTKEEQIFLGREIAQHKDYSEVTAIAIDEEIKKMVTRGYETAKAILSTNIHILHALAQALIEREELNAEDIDRGSVSNPNWTYTRFGLVPLCCPRAC